MIVKDLAQGLSLFWILMICGLYGWEAWKRQRQQRKQQREQCWHIDDDDPQLGI